MIHILSETGSNYSKYSSEKVVC